MSNKDTKKHSKFLSLILRHKPQTIGIELDENGWVDVDVLLSAMNKNRKQIDKSMLEEIVETNDKKRFAFNDDKTKIRASQGHSINIDLGLEEVKPPRELYHGTAASNYDSIFRNGLEKRGRNHVHLSKDPQTAREVGSRHGKPIVLVVNSGDMRMNGIKFYLSENGVYLTDFVAPRYIGFLS